MYRYEDMREGLFTDAGQRVFLEIRDRVHELLKTAGAFSMAGAFTTGDTWMMMASVDRLVELGEIREIAQGDVAGQDRIFVAARGR